MKIKELRDSYGEIEICQLLDYPEVTSLGYEIKTNGYTLGHGYNLVYAYDETLVPVVLYKNKRITHSKLFKIIDKEYKRYNKLKRILKHG